MSEVSGCLTDSHFAWSAFESHLFVACVDYAGLSAPERDALKTLPLFAALSGESLPIDHGEAFILGVQTDTAAAAAVADSEGADGDVVASALSGAGFGIDVLPADVASSRGDKFLKTIPEFTPLYLVCCVGCPLDFDEMHFPEKHCEVACFASSSGTWCEAAVGARAAPTIRVAWIPHAVRSPEAEPADRNP